MNNEKRAKPQPAVLPPPYVHSPSSGSALPGPQMTSAPDAVQIGRDYQAQLFARCAVGDHSPETRYGICGILMAVLLFPVGLVCLCIDKKKKCVRCGEPLV